MIRFKQLAKNADSDAITALRAVASEAGNRGVFNPTVLSVGDSPLIAFRAVDGRDSKIHAYLAFMGERGSADLIDLSDLGKNQGIDKVADPKLFSVADEVYLTFNTGAANYGSFNDIYVMQVFPKIGEVQKVVADFERQGTEKNWAFFMHDDGQLRAIYSLFPYSEVVLNSGSLGTGDLHFKRFFPDLVDTNLKRNLAIGTQPYTLSGELRIMAHEKWWIARKRSYVGRAVTVEGAGTNDVVIRVTNTRFIHDWRSALPRRGVHNRNLLSATYFSGAQVQNGKYVLTYGINDIDFSIARFEEDPWQA